MFINLRVIFAYVFDFNFSNIDVSEKMPYNPHIRRKITLPEFNTAIHEKKSFI